MSQNIQKVVLHNILLQKRADILHLFVFIVVLAAILNLLAMDFETHCPYLTPCQVSKTCHQVQDCSKYQAYISRFPAVSELIRSVAIMGV